MSVFYRMIGWSWRVFKSPGNALCICMVLPRYFAKQWNKMKVICLHFRLSISGRTWNATANFHLYIWNWNSVCLSIIYWEEDFSTDLDNYMYILKIVQVPVFVKYFALSPVNLRTALFGSHPKDLVKKQYREKVRMNLNWVKWYALWQASSPNG